MTGIMTVISGKALVLSPQTQHWDSIGTALGQHGDSIGTGLPGKKKKKKGHKTSIF